MNKTSRDAIANYLELEQHTIQKINVKRTRSRFPRLIGKNSRLPEHGFGYEISIVELITDKGVSGWGLKCDWPAKANGSYKEIDALKAAFIGKKVSELFDPQVGILTDQATQLDLALHDLAGKILGIPVYKMLGNVEQDTISCYDGAIYMNDISPDSRPGGLEAIMDDCRQDYELGYRAFKIKIGRGGMWMPFEDGLKRDIQVTRMIREKYPDCEILVDGNDKYTIDGLLQYMDAVYDCNLYWIEEPFQENREDLLILKEYLTKKSPRTLIADGEFEPDILQLKSLVEEKLLDVLLMDIEGFGFTNWRKFMPYIQETNCLVSPHAWGLKLKTHYTAQLAKAHKSAITVEGVIDTTEGIDFDQYKLVNGQLYVPENPGFGMDLIWAKDE